MPAPASKSIHLTSKQADGELFLRTEAPAFLVDVALRALVRQYHPDRAADPADLSERAERQRKVARLNLAYEWIRRG